MEIRKALESDLDIVCELYEQVYAYNATQQPTYFQNAKVDKVYFKESLQNETNAYFIALDDGKPVGICHVAEKQTPPPDYYVPHKFAVLIDNFITADYRGGGLGKRMTEIAKEWTRERGLDYLELRVLHLNDFARSFYEREGFDLTAHTMRCILD